MRPRAHGPGSRIRFNDFHVTVSDARNTYNRV